MRNEKEIIELILSIAKTDERIRAVRIDGSRANPNAPKDIYQDYDISFFVTDVKSFLLDKSWISKFGDTLIIQEPDWNDNCTRWYSSEPHEFEKSYGWLMLFDDGNRIDLGIISLNEKQFFEASGEPTITLIDKDGLLPTYPIPSDAVYWVKKPDDSIYYACCNDFWWCLNNVAKGIARDELPYAMEMLNHYVRDMLNHMIEWYIGVKTDFSVSAGKMGKYFKRYLPVNLYKQYCDTYSNSNYDNIWVSIYSMCDLCHDLAIQLADSLGFIYRQHEEDGIRKYLEMVKSNTTK